MKFKELHNQENPLLIANVWDVSSAKVAEHLNFHAIGTSSAAMASLLGYKDGEDLAFEELEFLVKRIAKCTNLPLSVDLESGYSRNPEEIAKNIIALSNLGVEGINIEDSIVKDQRHLLNVDEFSKMLAEVKNLLNQEEVDVFVNVRTDTFLLGCSDSIEESRRRIAIYEQAGADGIFVPCIVQESDIRVIVDSTSLPVNVMCVPNLPNFDQLTELGVKRISMGNFLYDYIYRQLEMKSNEIMNQKSFHALF
ncbi:isocitrate lyase/PEP mutase family protein [Reichenbachiella sp.]|uniref:isocitrate lyase/PEP mutase family protein n=1 Tax=Reichenbachiella sp. TaxID=2184521 RepID=UPI003BB0397A